MHNMKDFIKDFLFTEKNSNAFTLSMMVFMSLLVQWYIFDKAKNLVCFEKSQFIEIEKQLKIKKLLRGTINNA